MSAYPTAVNKLRMVRILNVKAESPTVKIFTFRDKLCAKAVPGQFLMLWIPGVDEIPLSISDVDEKEVTVSIAVKCVGEATQALHGKRVGDLIGVRGPFGKGFTLTNGKVLVVGGGIGVAPLLFLAKKLAFEGAKIVLVVGAKTKDELLFLNQFEGLCEAKSIFTATEDGTCGFKGLASTLTEKLLAKEKFAMVYACGPEPLIRKVFELAEKTETPFEASLERLMRCAIGLCGTCTVGRYRVCKDGPVFTANQLKEVKDEFGIWKRDFDGRKISV
ncbi:MAG: dihydroorotate dehydrogenase electron transfer subunit [Candidatus Bathyarchaeia archaeon]